MRNSKFIMLTGLFLFSFGVSKSQSPPVYNIKVNNNGYKGRLAISSSANYFFLNGDTSLILHADTIGIYYLNTGATISDNFNYRTSNIVFFFNKAGEIDSISPKNSASIGTDKKSISLETVSLTIDPGNFNREWYPSFGVNMNHDPGFYYGKQKLLLIKGITYNIDFAHSDLVLNCSTDPLYYGSTFNFSMLANGKIDLYDRNNISAKTSGNKISFNTIMVSLSPQEISGGEPLLINKPNAAAIKIIKNTSLPFIKGTVNYVYWYNSEGNMKYFHFLPM